MLSERAAGGAGSPAVGDVGGAGPPAVGGVGGAGPPALVAVDGALPSIAHLNVSANSSMHIGPKFVSVTQNIHARDDDKGRGAARRAWAWARGSSWCERAACGLALAALLALGALAAALGARAPAPAPDEAPHAWNISRAAWALGDERRDDHEERFAARFSPPRLVVVQHTAGPECRRYDVCAALMRNLRDDYFREKHYDLPYNFVIGNDGRVYEGRGWGVVGAHTLGLNRCALGLAFTGDYRSVVSGPRPTAAQMEAARALVASGERGGGLRARALVLAASDVRPPSASPGDLLLAALRPWPRFAAGEDAARFRDRSCDQIYDMLAADDERAAAR